MGKVEKRRPAQHRVIYWTRERIRPDGYESAVDGVIEIRRAIAPANLTAGG